MTNVDKSVMHAPEQKASQLINTEEMRYRAIPLWSRALLMTIVGSVGFGFVFACIARIDEVVIARGELQALGAERPIKSPFGGVVSEILVKEGQIVNEGQSLIQLDQKSYDSQEEAHLAQLISLKKTLLIKKDIVKRLKLLAKQGGISMIEYLNNVNDLQEIESQIIQTNAKLNGIKNEAKKTLLVSPLKGKVFDLVPSSSGYVVLNGETLLKIVPEGSLEAKVFLSNADIGFVKPEMQAQIRVDAYPFTQFGSLPGVVKAVGEEVLPADQQNPQPRFPAYIDLEREYLERNKKRFNVRSGQSVSANLIVRNKPVISLLTDIAEKAWDSLRGIKSDRS